MSCFSCCPEDDMQKPYDNGPFPANNFAGRFHSQTYASIEANNYFHPPVISMGKVYSRIKLG